jgi:hypothetical protein
LFLSTFEGDGYLTTKDWVKVALVKNDISGINPTQKDTEDWLFKNPNNSGVLALSDSEEVFIYNLQGKLIIHSKNAKVIDISSLKTGIYIVKNKQGKQQKLIIN